MYNRYIPQSDGSYQRRKIQEHPPKPPEKSLPPQPEPSSPPPCPMQEPPGRCVSPPRPRSRPQREPEQGGSITGFLKQLLPRDFDTGDLIVVLLLLLMSGDCPEDQNTALLTLALYLFM